MDSLRTIAALFTAKTFSFLIHLLTRGGGTAAPGLYALKLDPKLLRNLSQRITKGTVVVAGTNGKTTTSRMLAAILAGTDQTVIHNREGSNLLRGIASALIKKANFSNKPIADYALWEIDEATLPLFLHEVKPQLIILTNLFRDQLDRYGEVNSIRNRWRNALEQLDQTTTVILNADDPSLAHLGHNLHCRVVYYGLETNSRYDVVSTSADANFCPVCTKPLSYDAIYFSHVGKYHCHKCGFTRPEPSVLAKNIEHNQDQTTAIVYSMQSDKNLQPTTYDLAINLPGLYNLYNALAACTAGLFLKIDKKTILDSLHGFKSAFGRVETIAIGQKQLKLFLVKNPTGFNEVLHTLLGKQIAERMAQSDKDDLRLATSALPDTTNDEPRTRNDLTNNYEPIAKNLLIGINDNFADGTDVSWLWDVDFEKLHGRVGKVMCTGIRRYDLAIRLKYANFAGQLEVEEDLAKIIDQFVASDQTELIVLPTYTVMLDIRKYLVKKGHIKHYLKEM